MKEYKHPEQQNITITAEYDPHLNNDGRTYVTYGIGTDGSRYEIRWRTEQSWDEAQVRMNALEDLIWTNRHDEVLVTQYLDELEELSHKWSDETDACDWHTYTVRKFN